MIQVGTVLPSFEQSPNAKCPGCGSRVYEEWVGYTQFLCGIELREIEQDGEWVYIVDGCTRDEVRCAEFHRLYEIEHLFVSKVAGP